METDVDAFARILRSFRERRTLSQRELGAAAVLDHKTVMAYERGTTVPRTEEIQRELAPNEREDELLQILDREPFLIVLDGLERILLAYARMDVAYLADEDLDTATANVIMGAAGATDKTK
jgi:transcriptional regulator with XRE-family HTH domain